MSMLPLSTHIHPRRLFSIYNNMGAFLRVWRKNRETEKAQGLFAKREGLPLPYIRHPPNTQVAKIDSLDFGSSMTSEIEQQELLSNFAAFWIFSRQIFQFDPSLTRALRDTDVSNIPWDEIEIPHKDFYLAFPEAKNPTFTLKGIDYQVDGAYVLDSTGTPLIAGRSLTVRITAHPISVTTEELIAQDRYKETTPLVTATLGAEPTETVQEALANGLLLAAENSASRDNMVQAAIADLLAQTGGTGFIPKPVDSRARNAQIISIVEQTLPLIINSIFYLTQRPEDAETRFPYDASSRLTAEIENPATTHKNRRRAESELSGMGLSRITFVTNRELEANRSGETPESNRTVSTHLRRGHWRRFAHGEGRTLRKWRFVPPVLVNANHGDLQHGAIHIVRGPNDTN